MRKKNIKLTITETNTQTATPNKTIKITSNNPYFFKTLSIEHLNLPPSILQKYQIEITIEHIIFQNKKDHTQTNPENLIEKIKKFFDGIFQWTISEDDIEGKQQDLIRELTKERYRYILGYKKFTSQQGLYDKGDYIFFSKTSIKTLINNINNFTTHNDLLFSLDEHLQNKSLQNIQNFTNIIITQNLIKIQQICNFLYLNLDKIQPQISKPNNIHKFIPTFSISLTISGNIKYIHILYQKINQIIAQFLSKIYQITDQKFVPERINKIPTIFKGTIYENKIFKISNKTILLLQKKLDCEDLRNKLKSKIWILDRDQFTDQDIRILLSQHKSNSLNLYMKLKKVDYDFIKFENGKLLLSCDQYTRDKFIRQCTILLKNYVKQRQYCRTYDNNLIIKIFRKYFLNIIQNKYGVIFEIGQNYLIRNNFTKYSQQIQQQLKNIRNQIQTNIITYITKTPIKNHNNINALYQQINQPNGYQHEFLGCKIYLYRNIKIKLKPIESLQRQQPTMAYILDDRLSNNSIFYNIIKQNQINLNSFLADAHRNKKPQRLRQYITQHCHYSNQTCILHAGKEKVTQTLKRDLQSLFSLLKNNICLTILKHQQSYYYDVFQIILTELAAYSAKIAQDVAGLVNPSKTQNVFIPKQIQQTSIYYQGGSSGLKIIQNIFHHLSISKIAQFYLQKLDLEKIYALEYQQTQIKINKCQNIKISPIISQILSYELNSKNIKTNNKNLKRCIFSCFLNTQKSPNSKQTLIQYIICTKNEFIYKITHHNKNGNFSKNPQIQKIKQTFGQLNIIMKIIKQYFKNSQFTIISSKIINNGIFQKTQFSPFYYIATENNNSLTQTIINIKQQKILSTNTQSTYQIIHKINPLKQCYEIVTYGSEINDILPLIS